MCPSEFTCSGTRILRVWLTHVYARVSIYLIVRRTAIVCHSFELGRTKGCQQFLQSQRVPVSDGGVVFGPHRISMSVASLIVLICHVGVGTTVAITLVLVDDVVAVAL
jgi:hypothetical protein